MLIDLFVTAEILTLLLFVVGTSNHVSDLPERRTSENSLSRGEFARHKTSATVDTGLRQSVGTRAVEGSR